MAAETSGRDVSRCQYPRNLRPRFFLPFGPRRRQTQVLLASRKGSKPFYECAVSCFSLMVLNFFLHELLEGGANDEVLYGVIWERSTPCARVWFCCSSLSFWKEVRKLVSSRSQQGYLFFGNNVLDVEIFFSTLCSWIWRVRSVKHGILTNTRCLQFYNWS